MMKNITFIPFTRVVPDNWSMDAINTITDVKGFTDNGNRVSFIRHSVTNNLDTGEVISNTIKRMEA